MSRVTIDLSALKSDLAGEAEDMAQRTFTDQKKALKSGLTRDRIANRLTQALGAHVSEKGKIGEHPEIVAYRNGEKNLGKILTLLMDVDDYRLAHDLRKDMLSLSKAEAGHETYDEILKGYMLGVDVVMKDTEKNAKRVAKALEQAARRVREWGNHSLSVKPVYDLQDMDYEHGVGSFNVIMQPHNLNFTVFTDAKLEMGDVLDAGDPEFFHDPQAEMNYFDLVKEIEKPGSSSKPGKNLTLWTARPTKDRKLYLHAKHVPSNIFLTTDMHRASGIAHDLGAGEVRDLWKMVINELHLMKTLEAGRIKDYQTIGKKQVPVVRTILVAEGEADMSIYQRALPLLQELQAQMGERKLPLEEADTIEERTRGALHWVKQKYGAAKAAAHRAFLKMVRKDPAAHRRKMRQDKKYHRMHKWHDALMRRTARKGWKREAVAAGGDYRPYCDFGSQAFSRYLEANPDIDPEEFGRFVTAYNRADRDSGELEDIAADEIARLGQEFAAKMGLEERDPGQAFMDLPFELRVTERSDPSSMKVQTLIFSKDRFTRKSAVKWATSHGFTASKVDEKENTFRIRQKDPGQFETFRTITFKPGLKAVVAKV